MGKSVAVGDVITIRSQVVRESVAKRKAGREGNRLVDEARKNGSDFDVVVAFEKKKALEDAAVVAAQKRNKAVAAFKRAAARSKEHAVVDNKGKK